MTLTTSKTYMLTVRRAEDKLTQTLQVSAIDNVASGWTLLDNFDRYSTGALPAPWGVSAAGNLIVDVNGNRLLNKAGADLMCMLPLSTLTVKEGDQRTLFARFFLGQTMAACQTAQVFESGCALLVPLVEEGWLDHQATKLILREYLTPLRRHRIDTLLLACTHFPLLKEAIRTVVGEKIALVDCADTSARFARERLEQLGLLRRNRRRPGVFQDFVTDEPQRFTSLASRFLGEPINPAMQVVLPPL